MSTAKRKSRHLIKLLDRSLRSADTAESMFYCWRVEKLGISYTTEQKIALSNAQTEFHQARTKVKMVWAEILGEAIVSEVENNEWRDAK